MKASLKLVWHKLPLQGRKDSKSRCGWDDFHCMVTRKSIKLKEDLKLTGSGCLKMGISLDKALALLCFPVLLQI